jgi:thiamine biosynthesis lipoprotein
MGLPVSVLARGGAARDPSAGAATDALVDAFFAELVVVDALFSPYRADSEVSRLARGELTLAACDPLVRDVARRCEAARRDTGGLFDATTPDGGWDPSGLVKGWAVERATRHLLAAPGLDWCVNAGGDVVVLSPSGTAFRVGVQDPRDDRRVAAVLDRASGGVATSGTAARGAHLYDPRSGAAAVASASVTVTGPFLETADVLATAAFVAGDGALALVEAVPAYEALRIGLDGSLGATSGWPGRGV